jgi:endonuclease G
LVLLVLVATAGTAWAEYCRSQGESRVPAAEAKKYDKAVLLSPSEVTAAEDTHLRWGKPDCGRYLYHREFVLCYDPERRVPLWVVYRLDRADLKKLARRNAFRTDPRLLPAETATCDDYAKRPTTARDFDRGHMVPNADMNRSKVAQANSYFLSNMSPQHFRFNQGVWADLEDRVRDWARSFRSLWVISGSVFDRDNDKRPDVLDAAEWKRPTRRVAVPSHYYKILVREGPDGALTALALLLPHVKDNPRDFERFLADGLVSVEEIQQRTGARFFSAIPTTRREALEAAVASRLWPRN